MQSLDWRYEYVRLGIYNCQICGQPTDHYGPRLYTFRAGPVHDGKCIYLYMMRFEQPCGLDTAD